MSFFGNLFHLKKSARPVILIDISPGSVAGAYALFNPGGQPTILYTRRLSVETHGSEQSEKAMLRALGTLGDTLIREGAPELMRATGSGRSDAIFISVDAPWQATSVRTEHLEQPEPFTFTKDIVEAALKKTSTAQKGKIVADESIIGTILNGYETHTPYGKETSRASIIVLSSLLDEQVTKDICTKIHALYHTKDIFTIAGSSLRYQTTRMAFPHERDVLILDATGETASLALVRKGLLVTIVEIQSHTKGTAIWTDHVTDALKELSERFPLPRTIFLLAREPEIHTLREKLDAAKFGSLWLSNNPPKMVSVLGGHLSGFVRQTTTSAPDLSLFLMALFFQHQLSVDEV